MTAIRLIAQSGRSNACAMAPKPLTADGFGDLWVQTLRPQCTPEDEASKTNNFLHLQGIEWLDMAGASDCDGLIPVGWHGDRARICEPHVVALDLELL